MWVGLSLTFLMHSGMNGFKISLRIYFVFNELRPDSALQVQMYLTVLVTHDAHSGQNA